MAPSERPIRSLFVPRPGNRRLLARFVGVLYLGGVVLGVISLLLPNTVDAPWEMWALAAVATLIGAALVVAGRRTPLAVAHLAIALATVIVSLAVIASGGSYGVLGTLYYWVAIGTAYAFRLPIALAYFAWILGWLAFLLSQVTSAGFGELGRWVVTGLSLGVIVAATSWIASRREHAERRRKRFFDLSVDMLATASDDGRLVEVNPAWERTLGYTREQFRTAPFLERVHPDDRERTLAEWDRLRNGGQPRRFEHRVRAKSGEWRWISWISVYAPDEHALYARATDVTGMKQLEYERDQLLARLGSEARTDPLTELPNRRWLEQELDREIERSRRHGFGLALAIVDLDGFKAFNDTHGHPTGDGLLIEAASAWRETLRAVDFIGRFGGDEFIVVLPSTSGEQAGSVIDRMRAATPAPVTATAGIALWRPGEDAETLIARADDALYAAKRAGGDRTVVDGGHAVGGGDGTPLVFT